MSRREAIRDKIMARVAINAESGCYVWLGPDSGKNGRGSGYPRMNLDGGTMAVHIALWIVDNGPIPPRKQLDHTCRNRMCVNPEHCEMVTPKINARRREKARK